MTPVAIYARQSSTDPDELEASGSIEDQRTALLDLAERKDWNVVGIYEDPDAPWDRLDRRGRWLDLLEDAAAGRFEVVAAFDTSRLWRSVEFKIHTCRELAAAGVTTIATLGGETPTDPREDPEGSFVGTVLAAVSEYDNQMRALKVRRAHLRAARSGVAWQGQRLFGYSDDRSEIVEQERALILEAYERVVKRKEPLNAIARDWRDRGVLTTAGNLWERGPLIRMLRSPALAGWRVLHGTRYKGDWKPILTDDQHAQLVAALSERKRFAGGPGEPQLLSSTGLTRCGLCGTAVVAAHKRRGYRVYRCPPQDDRGCGGVTVSAERAEEEVVGRVLASIDPELVAWHVEAAAEADAQVAAASRVLETIESRRQQIGRLFTRTGDADAARAALDELETIERSARRDLRRGTVHVELLTEVVADPHRWWDEADFLDQRRLLEIVCERVIVHPSSTRGRQWDPERIEIRWRV